MEIQQLRYFLSAANSSSFSQAAKRCFTSRQNIAHSVGALERELGAVLFERRGNGVRLTSAGLQAACLADDILNRVDSLQSAFGPPPSREEGLGIAVSYGFLGRIPEEAESFVFGFEQRISMFEMGCEDCYRAVCSGEEDVGLVLCMKRDFPDCDSDEVGRLKAYAIVNECSPLARKRQLSVFDLKTQKLQIMSESAFQHEPLFADLGSLGYDFSGISVAASASTLYGVKRNEAIGIATSKFAENVPEGMLAVPLDDPRYDWRAYALYSRQAKSRTAVARFIQGFRKNCSLS